MRLEDFLSRHGLEENPFVSAEEAQGDVVLSHILEQSNFRLPDLDRGNGIISGK
jgi:hypothetical protein